MEKKKKNFLMKNLESDMWQVNKVDNWVFLKNNKASFTQLLEYSRID